MTNQTSRGQLTERITTIAAALGVDAGALAGAALVMYGIDLMHRPSAFIVGGLLLMALCLLAARRS
jgi:hypothetical protein